jgi:tRNA (adenine57-N1/adenine58-N1)-methyltransferase
MILGPERHRGPLQSGEVVILYDRRGRRYRLKLAAGASYHTHMGTLVHGDLIGKLEGCFVSTNKKSRLLALRPTLLEAVEEMPRQSQVIYPKDLGAILIRGDIYPGARVLEVGLGTGATATALLRAVGPEGEVVSYEVRPEAVEGARRNIEELLPSHTTHTIKLRDPLTEGIEELDLDRVVMDIPEPWKWVQAAAEALRPGGLLLCFLPTVLQVHELGVSLLREPRFHLVQTVEVLERPWHVTVRSVRPEHRMVAHTGFITTARRGDASTLATGTEPDTSDDVS